MITTERKKSLKSPIPAQSHSIPTPQGHPKVAEAKKFSPIDPIESMLYFDREEVLADSTCPVIYLLSNFHRLGIILARWFGRFMELDFGWKDLLPLRGWYFLITLLYMVIHHNRYLPTRYSKVAQSCNDHSHCVLVQGNIPRLEIPQLGRAVMNAIQVHTSVPSNGTNKSYH